MGGEMKKQLTRKPHVPRSDRETIRHGIIAILRRQAMSALEISTELHIPERDVYPHLEHIRLSLHASAEVLHVTPAECRRCGFVFTKRGRLTSPSRCPLCRGEGIFPPLFAIGEP